MSASRRSILAAAGTSIALSQIANSTNAAAQAQGASVADQLIRQSAEANAALMHGDTDGYLALITHADDYTLMSPFGGTPTRGSDLTGDRWEAMRRFFRNGTFEQELVQSYGSADMVVLAIIERPRVEVGGLPVQEWALRVTLVYRREGTEWRLAHRHADPLVKGVSLEQAAALARGNAT
jgi:ketosteroid isomerase-like protein